jgi:hypothetical protein
VIAAARVAALVLPLLAPLGLSAQAQEVEVGTSLVCDTQEQVERFIALYDGDAQSAIDRVNAEHDPRACAVSNMAYVRGPQLATARSKDAGIAELVVGRRRSGLKPVTRHLLLADEVEEPGLNPALETPRAERRERRRNVDALSQLHTCL